MWMVTSAEESRRPDPTGDYYEAITAGRVAQLPKHVLEAITPYTYSVEYDKEDEIYVARVAEFESLAAHGDTEEEALSEIRSVVQGVLEDLEITRDQIIRAFLQVQCLDQSLGRLSHGQWTQSLKMLAFAFASYPGHTLCLPRTYLLAALLGLGPLGIWLSRLGRWLFHDRGRP